MAHDIFLSYSSRDQAAADMICQALEGAGIKCWIAPRDIAAGSQWGGSIVAAIEASRAVLIIFSEKSNDSPQVAREMECAVAKRLPLIPVRIADAMPTKDMEYFLGVSHWLNAYPEPLSTYLPQIVVTTQRVLKGEAQTWKRFARKLPQKRYAQLSLVGVALLAAVVTAWLMRPSPPPNPMDAMRSPLAGRWQASLADARGTKEDCVLDVQDLGQAQFTDSCPAPYTGNKGNIGATKDSTYNPQLFVKGKDTGTFMMQAGSIPYTTGTFRLDGRNSLILHFADGKEISWRRIAQDAPLHNDVDSILPKEASWPVAGVPAIAERAIKYARGHWQPDAVLMSAKLTLEPQAGGMGGLPTAAGTVTVQFELYSPATQQGLSLTPGSAASAMFPLGAVDRDARQAIPADFLDLPQAWAALQARGLRGKQLKEAQLEDWQNGTSYGSARLAGLEWVLDSALDERGWVPAAR